MIKLFKKIRQQLLSQSKLSKYLIYAIGEIVLVVIGILIAIQINNWNEDQKKSDREKILVANFLEDIKTDSLGIQILKSDLFNRSILMQELFLASKGEIT